jgi:hypothetical protein
MIDACGPAYARRFFLTDGGEHRWHETEGWNPKEATLFATADAAGRKMHELMQALPGQLYRFMAPLIVEVKSPMPVDLAALQEWLDKAVEVYINATHGVGPGECMVMIQFGWDELKEQGNA